MQEQGRKTAEAKAAHAALVERASGLAIEIQRLDEASRELENRLSSRREDVRRNGNAPPGARRNHCHVRDDGSTKTFARSTSCATRSASPTIGRRSLRAGFEAQETHIRESRRSLEGIRGEVAHLDVERATAESDLTHLASSCVELTQATLDEVAAEVEQMERDGVLAAPEGDRRRAGCGGVGRRRRRRRRDGSCPGRS